MKTVFVSGCFDAFHAGHLLFLEWARSLGDRLVVSLAADETVRALKREPLWSAEDRAALLKALRCVDQVIVAPPMLRNPAGDFEPVIREVRPQVWAIGPDDVNADFKAVQAEDLGCDLVQDQRPKPYSTTALIATASERAHRVDVETPTVLRPVGGCVAAY